MVDHSLLPGVLRSLDCWKPTPSWSWGKPWGGGSMVPSVHKLGHFYPPHTDASGALRVRCWEITLRLWAGHCPSLVLLFLLYEVSGLEDCLWGPLAVLSSQTPCHLHHPVESSQHPSEKGSISIRRTIVQMAPQVSPASQGPAQHSHSSTANPIPSGKVDVLGACCVAHAVSEDLAAWGGEGTLAGHGWLCFMSWMWAAGVVPETRRIS